MADTVRLTFDGVDTLENRLLGIPAAVQAVLITKIDILTALAQTEVQANLTGTVLNQRTGKLLRAVQVTPAHVTSPGVVDGSVGVDQNDPSYIYGITHEKGGLKAYVIKAKNAKALAFPGVVDTGFGFETNGLIFAKQVIHPPAKRRPWIGPVGDNLRPRAIEEIAEGVNEVLK